MDYLTDIAHFLRSYIKICRQWKARRVHAMGMMMVYSMVLMGLVYTDSNNV
jgi:hypothetical protein